MTNTAKNITVAVAAVGTFATVFHLSMQAQVVEAFPTIEPKIAKKAYNRLFRKAITGKYAGIEMTNDNITALFLAEVDLLSPAFNITSL